ncbi:MAG: hypothetical protein HC846_12040 [Blastocatellia bacterium]|nr:hypothetical protein [Blastocatellia bacterium]
MQKQLIARQLVKASFNPTNEVFCVEGLTVGQTRVTFAGTYRQDGNNNNNNNGGMIGGLQQNGVRFKYDLDVTVVQRVENTETNVFNVQVERGKNKDIRIETLLGQEFANTADNGEKWRNIVLTEGNKEVVRGDLFDNNQLKVRVTGVNSGKTKLILQGELLKNNVWETITRTLEVTVTTGSVEPADPWLEAMKRRLADLKTPPPASRKQRN